MSFGLQVFNAAGGIILDTNTRAARILARISTGTANGSYTYSGAFSGELQAVLDAPNYGNGGSRIPSVSVSGTTVNWSFSAGLEPARACIIIVFVF